MKRGKEETERREDVMESIVGPKCHLINSYLPGAQFNSIKNGPENGPKMEF